VAMSTDYNAVACDSVEDKLCILATKAVQAFLDYVIAIEVLDHGHNTVLQGENDSLDLRGS